MFYCHKSFYGHVNAISWMARCYNFNLIKHISDTWTHVIVRSCFFNLILIIWLLTICELHVTMIKGVYSLECIQWTSSRDGKYRSHCYEYLQETRNSTFEAEATCKMSGGQLAPFVDEFQFNFWRDFLPTVRYKVFF